MEVAAVHGFYFFELMIKKLKRFYDRGFSSDIKKSKKII
jgi:hypothetical protein